MSGKRARANRARPAMAPPSFIAEARERIARRTKTVEPLPPPSSEANPDPTHPQLDPNDRDKVDQFLRFNFNLGPHANHITPPTPHIADYVPLGLDFNIAPPGAPPGTVQYVVTPRMCTHCGRVSVVFKGYPDEAQHGPFLVFEQPSAKDLLHLPG